MAGSIKWFVYTCDDGSDFALKADESNVEAVNGSTQDFPGTPPTKYALPRNVKPRRAYYTSADGTVTRGIVCLTTSIYNGVDAAQPTITDAVSGLTLSLKRKKGEEISLPFGADTGLQDGDAT